MSGSCTPNDMAACALTPYASGVRCLAMRRLSRKLITRVESWETVHRNIDYRLRRLFDRVHHPRSRCTNPDAICVASFAIDGALMDDDFGMHAFCRCYRSHASSKPGACFPCFFRIGLHFICMRVSFSRVRRCGRSSLSPGRLVAHHHLCC